MSSDTAWRKHLRPSLASLTVYDVPPSTASARLHANESPFRWPAAVQESMSRALAELELNRYPDTSGRSLRAMLAEGYGCDPERIVLGNGSDEIISILLNTIPGPLVIPTPTFVMYAHSAKVLGLEVREVPLLQNTWQLDMDAMRAALPGAAVCFLARPNNPTSSLFSALEVKELVTSFPETIFVIDEAYAAYSPGISLWSLQAPSNFVYMSTLSKVGLAALRLGYCIAPRPLADEMNKVRHPYNLNSLSLRLAELILREHSRELEGMVQAGIESRDAIAAILRGHPGAEVYEAHANFVLAKLGTPAYVGNLVSRFHEQGVRIKDMSGVPGLEGCVRISAGTREELDLLESALARA